MISSIKPFNYVHFVETDEDGHTHHTTTFEVVVEFQKSKRKWMVAKQLITFDGHDVYYPAIDPSDTSEKARLLECARNKPPMLAQVQAMVDVARHLGDYEIDSDLRLKAIPSANPRVQSSVCLSTLVDGAWVDGELIVSDAQKQAIADLLVSRRVATAIQPEADAKTDTSAQRKM